MLKFSSLLVFFSLFPYSLSAEYDPVIQKMQSAIDATLVRPLSLHKQAKSATGDWSSIGPEGTEIKYIESTTGGDTVFLGTTAGHIFISTDSGLEWTRRMIMTSLYPYLPWIHFVHYTNSQLYVATSLGLYKSNDFGESWQELITAIEVSFQAIYADERDPDILYAATYHENPYFGGFIKSYDGGETWNSYNNGLPTTSVYKLVRSPHNDQAFYACTPKGLFKTTNAGEVWLDANGGLAKEPALAFAVHPRDSNRVYLGNFSGLYASDDRGENWRHITPPAQTPEIRAIAVGGDSLLLVGTPYGVYKTRDGGSTWRNTSSGLHNPSITDIKIITDSLIYLSTMEGFYISKDKGESWQRRVQDIRAFPGKYLVFGGDRLFCGTTGAGLYSYGDGEWRDEDLDDAFLQMEGMAWNPLNHSLYAAYISVFDQALGKSRSGVLVFSPENEERLKNIVVNQTYLWAVAPSRFDPATLFVGAVDGVYQSIDFGESWLHSDGLRGQGVFTVAASPYDSEKVFAGAAAFSKERRQGVYQSKDKAYTFQYACELAKKWVYNVPQIIFHPASSDTMYAANGIGVLFSYDGGDNWNVRQRLTSGNLFYVYTVQHHPFIPGRVYAGGDALYLSEDAGLSWRTLAELPEGAGIIASMVIDPQHPEDVYASTTGAGVLRYRLAPTHVAEKAATPRRFHLRQNYPNPFNASTTLRFTLPVKAKVNISMFDVNGKRIKILTDGEISAGEHKVKWDGTDENRRAAASGVYFCRMTRAGKTQVVKMTLLR